MKANLLRLVERQATEFRQRVGLSETEAVNLKSLLLKLNILTVYRQMTDKFSGMSLKNPKGDGRFMLINASIPRCLQHFTIAHELYHLYIDHNPVPHNCEIGGVKDETEQCADAFAHFFLMPGSAILQLVPKHELESGDISLGTILKLEHYFSVSHQAMLNRLLDMKLLSKQLKDTFINIPVIKTAREYGYDTNLYTAGNDGLVIGDFGEKARNLLEAEKISEGHYLELLSKIGIHVTED